MSDFMYKIGDVFKPGYSDTYTVKGRVAADGSNWYWMFSSEGNLPATYREETLGRWTKVEPFFKVGDTFHSRDADYEVLFVTEKGSQPSALALADFGDEVRTERLSKLDYDWVKHKIKHSGN